MNIEKEAEKFLKELGYEVDLYRHTDISIQIGARKDNKEFYMAFAPNVPNPAKYYHEKFMEYYTGKLKRDQVDLDS